MSVYKPRKERSVTQIDQLHAFRWIKLRRELDRLDAVAAYKYQGVIENRATGAVNSMRCLDRLRRHAKPPVSEANAAFAHFAGSVAYHEPYEGAWGQSKSQRMHFSDGRWICRGRSIGPGPAGLDFEHAWPMLVETQS